MWVRCYASQVAGKARDLGVPTPGVTGLGTWRVTFHREWHQLDMVRFTFMHSTASGTKGVPVEWLTGKVVPIFKKEDWRNYWGITFISLPGKFIPRCWKGSDQPWKMPTEI